MHWLLFFLLFASNSLASDLTLPQGFKATVFHPGLGAGARHISVRDNSDVFVRFRSEVGGKGAAVLRDLSGNGKADIVKFFEDSTGTGIEVRGDYLYFSSKQEIFRQKLGELLPEGMRELIVTDLPQQHSHAAKSFCFDDKDGLFVNIGAPSNACQEQSRTPGSPGKNPCPELNRQAGIWKFAAGKLAQKQMKDGIHYVRGLRNAVALDWGGDALYVVQHGRDQLHSLFPNIYSKSANAILPAEEFHKLEEGSDLGWPYSYFDGQKSLRMLAPEYGGDGKKSTQKYQHPLIGFPAHWAPNDLLFYEGRQFPEKYHGGAFIAFHGSWNRAPKPQAGYRVVFVPFRKGKASKSFFTFADGFSGDRNLRSPGDARFRPMGLAEGPDGSLFISDSVRGRIWKVVYQN